MSAAVLRHAIKLGLAAGLAMAVVKLLGLPSGFWAALSALAVLQTQLGASLVNARNYLLASAVGVIFGAATLSVFGANVLIAAAGITLLALVCMRLRLPPPAVTTAGGVIPVLVLSVSESPWRYGVYRLIDVVVGVSTAMLVSALVWPSRSGDALRQAVADAVRAAGTYVAGTLDGLIAGSGPPADAARRETQIQQRLQAAQGLLGSAQHEPSRAPAGHSLLPLYLANGERIFEHASAVAEVAEGGLSAEPLRLLASHLRAVGAAITHATDALGVAIAGVDPHTALDTARAGASSLSDATEKLGAVDLSQAAQGGELLRLHTLVLGLQAFAREVERTVGRIEHPDRAVSLDEQTRLPN
jgi:uncharacterized membrane protein YccC